MARCRYAVPALLVAGFLIGCARRDVPPAPALVLGDFEDDYGNSYAVSDSLWIQRPDARYHIVAWHPSEEYLIAWNDSANASAQGQWTRIDWTPLEGMPPWTWAYCYSVYDAATAAAAESTTVADRSTPRSGCNGYPFSRMRSVTPG